MYYGGELNVPGAAGNVHNYNPNKIPPATAFQPNMNTTGAPVGYTQQPSSFMGLPGGIGNEAGLIAGNPSFDINESAGTRRIRGIRNLQSGGATAGERDAASNLLRNITSPIRLPNL